MEIALEHLALLPEIAKRLSLLEKQLLGSAGKRWLNTAEAAEYLGYSANRLHKLVGSGELAEGSHYHKPSGRLIFDRMALDGWVQGIDKTHARQTASKVVAEILSGPSGDPACDL